MTDAKRSKSASESLILNYSADDKVVKFAMQPLTAAVVTALSPAGAALAQDNEGAQLEEVIVTATKREINLQDVPHNIDVLSSVDLERMGAKNLDEQIKGLPSISQNNTVPGRNSLVIRRHFFRRFRLPARRTGCDLRRRTADDDQLAAGRRSRHRYGTYRAAGRTAGPLCSVRVRSPERCAISRRRPHTNGFGGTIEAYYGLTDDGEPSHDLSGVLNIPILDDRLAVRRRCLHVT